ncbi:hypothetical protein [Nocardiopsis lambiniae]|uniref:LytR family transcriptional regulator n=1 Tax=Nocardiopsis lambiniae TaxID=3075539 RepID=A0ABU2M5U8_9ACTN|nr:hypothetical protein [Nocardiopsis sp. DSM 44743]MDT0328021.1 hypothetical protein [Nocardiopsis sp. DSM 44743]
MMALLRSRTTMFVLVGIVVAGLVVSAAIGLFNSIGTAPVGGTAPQGGQGGAPPGASSEPDVPDVSALGDPPSGLSYSSDPEADIYCEQQGCGRLVTVGAEEGETPEDSTAAVREIYEDLLDRDWKIMLPSDVEDPEDLPLEEHVLTDGTVMVADSSPAGADGPTVLLLIGSGPQR